MLEKLTLARAKKKINKIKRLQFEQVSDAFIPPDYKTFLKLNKDVKTVNEYFQTLKIGLKSWSIFFLITLVKTVGKCLSMMSLMQ